MADFGMLFTLVLVALTFVIVGTGFIVYIMIIGEREKRKKEAGIPVSDGEPDSECPHEFGYLSGFPLDEPIPEECFGCLNAMHCMNEKRQTVETETENETEAEAAESVDSE